jgi:pyruvate dehydrogenase E1 component beta subunit
VFLEHRRVYDLEEAVPDDPDFVIPFGQAARVRDGEDLLIVAWGGMRALALDAAEALEAAGIDCGVLDLRTVAPLDVDGLLEAAEGARAVLIAEEGPRTGGVGAEIAATLAEQLGTTRPIARVAAADVPHPYDPVLEARLLPDVARIVARAQLLCRPEAATTHR